MKELAYHCSIYITAEPEETEEETKQRMEHILDSCGLEYQCYDTELREV